MRSATRPLWAPPRAAGRLRAGCTRCVRLDWSPTPSAPWPVAVVSRPFQGYTVLIDGAARRRDLKAAEAWLQEAIGLGRADLQPLGLAR